MKSHNYKDRKKDMKQKKSHIIVPEGCRRVLVHACCAPCSSAIIEWMLAHGIEPVIYYYNPNIYPQEEYEKRRDESRRHAESFGVEWIEDLSPALSQEEEETDYELRIKNYELQITDYESAHQEWLKAVRGLEREPERGRRCEACFYHRLQATALKAEELGIEFFATTLASSRWKNLEQVNTAGLKAMNDVQRDNVQCTKDNVQCTKVQFWAQNWRKDGLQDRRNALLKEFGFYNQQYCGCEFSIRKECVKNRS